ncbi:unnamed protein product [Plutella xylostella]|uniref:(diamondback moth) hypothetical protein n=1 Tax=Plutella xylostella TaxID=51655 RepID=A0A8S4G5F0_PLUXY|nr:unnamed protein product [Plutella xylostella]
MNAAAGTFAPDGRVQIRWIEQPLDHFDKKEKRMWLMRYFERLDFWRPNGPIYLFIGGEGEAHPGFLKAGMIYELAKETSGAMIMSEHRYYGKSMPLENRGVKNLRFLSARQALADIEKLLKRMKLLPGFKNSKVVAIGGSYPGNMAAWLKLLYPNLIDAALASSAPVLAQKNFKEYLETVSDDYEQYGTPQCWDYIKQKFEHYDNSFKTKAGIRKLKEEEGICESSDMNRPENQQLFVYSEASAFMGVAQYGTEKRIRKHCEQLMDDDSSEVKNNSLRSIFINDSKKHLWNRDEECYEIDFDEIIVEIRKGGSWLTSWVFQMCNEFSYAKSTSSENQPFGKNIPIETFYKICTLSFGPEYDEAGIEETVKKTNELYGGLTPNVTKVIFVNGELDPWHRLGILEDVSYDAPSKFIPRSSHCRDLLPNRDGDPDELVETRKYIKYLIKHWIGIEPCDLKDKRKECKNNEKS